MRKKESNQNLPQDDAKVVGRMVKINIWHDEKFQSLSDDGKLVWFHLYTNPLSNGLGLFSANIEGLAAAKRWDSKRYRKGFMEGLGKRLFLYDETFQVLYFPQFIRHNKFANPNVMVSLLKAWDYIPPTPYKHSVYADLKGLGKGFAERIETLRLTLPQTLPQTYSQTDTDTDTDTDTVTEVVQRPLTKQEIIITSSVLGGTPTNGTAGYSAAKSGGEF